MSGLAALLLLYCAILPTSLADAAIVCDSSNPSCSATVVVGPASSQCLGSNKPNANCTKAGGAGTESDVDPLASCPTANFYAANTPIATVEQQIFECLSAARQKPEALVGFYPCDSPGIAGELPSSAWLPDAINPRRTGYLPFNSALAECADVVMQGVLWFDVQQLAAAALGHSTDMADHNLFSHDGSDGSDLLTRVEDAGVTGFPLGENIAGGYTTVRGLVAAWMCSTGHRENILSCAFDSVGTGMAIVPSSQLRTYFTQDFGCTDPNYQCSSCVASPPAAPPSPPPAPPAAVPTASPTSSPTHSPTASPTASPTPSPSHSPTASPTASPTLSPSHSPTASPTPSPTPSPSHSPTASPTASPIASPTHSPTASPTPSQTPFIPQIIPETTTAAAPTPAHLTLFPFGAPVAVPAAAPVPSNTDLLGVQVGEPPRRSVTVPAAGPAPPRISPADMPVAEVPAQVPAGAPGPAVLGASPVGASGPTSASACRLYATNMQFSSKGAQTNSVEALLVADVPTLASADIKVTPSVPVQFENIKDTLYLILVAHGGNYTGSVQVDVPGASLTYGVTKSTSVVETMGFNFCSAQ